MMEIISFNNYKVQRIQKDYYLKKKLKIKDNKIKFNIIKMLYNY